MSRFVQNRRGALYSGIWLLLFAALWEGIALLRPEFSVVMPRLGLIAARFFKMLVDGRLLHGIAYSSVAVLVALFLSFLIALVLLYASRRSFLRSGVDTASALLGSLPGVAILPLVILWFGLTPLSLLCILVHAMLWPIRVSMSAAKDRLETQFGDFVTNYRIPYRRVFVGIFLQGAAMDLVGAARVAWSRGWRAVISVEMIFGLTGSGSGLGWLIYERRMYMDTAGMLAALFALSLCGLLFERGILGRRFRRSRESMASRAERSEMLQESTAPPAAPPAASRSACGPSGGSGEPGAVWSAPAAFAIGEPLLEVRSLTKAYPGEPPLFAPITFRLHRGEFLVLMGCSGVGKSSLLRILGGLDSSFDGEMIRHTKKASDSFAPLVFQESDTLLSWKSVEQNLMFVRPEITRDELTSILRAVGLFEHRNKRASELSGGMKQRLAVARAVVTRADVLLMDEPFTGLDANTRHDMWNFILDLRRTLGLTILLVTHSEEEATVLGDRILRLETWGLGVNPCDRNDCGKR
ncbi:MAG: ATP-binding cassette domain-containing protein [Bacillota bacterium]|nr:ATP-binding cassette domain-containing protein [Bacillota bacterium]